MPQYIDGFVHPIPRANLKAYKKLVAKVAEIWKEHGALDYQECVGDDLQFDGLRSFVDAADAKEGEVILFGWVVFESREARILINERVATDPRMAELMAASYTGFNPERMAYGGFQPFVDSPTKN